MIKSAQAVIANSPPEDILAGAAGFLELVIGYYDSLAACVREHDTTKKNEQHAAVSRLQRQMHIQVAVVESATAIIEELELCNSACGPTWDQAKIDRHRLELLDEIRGLADRSVPV